MKGSQAQDYNAGHATKSTEYIFFVYYIVHQLDFPGGSDGKEYACNAGDLGSIPGLGRSPGEGKGHPL